MVTKKNISLTSTSAVAIRNQRKIVEILTGSDPLRTIHSGQLMIQAWSESLPPSTRVMHTRAFMNVLISNYWKTVHTSAGSDRSLPKFRDEIYLPALDNSVRSVAVAIANACGTLDIIDASHYIGNVYTSTLSDTARAQHGVYYTPPTLTRRLIEIASRGGVDWSTSKVLDPACGGGAFLAPVTLKMLDALKGRPANEILSHIQTHLKGFEIDAYAGWLSQVFVEVALRDVIVKATVKFGPVVTICNSLDQINKSRHNFDVVIGNPPYGKVSLDATTRGSFAESLYGHANYYGLFTHLATELINSKGVIAWLTPTSFLSGEYFKNLRSLLGKKVSLLEADFISHRKGVFNGVLQETMLAVYKSSISKSLVSVNQITPIGGKTLSVSPIGKFPIHSDRSSPWILPRSLEQGFYVNAMSSMTSSLKDWGYQVSTGPLVWNRHKTQLTDNISSSSTTYPIVWAESLKSNGSFVLSSEKKNHKRYFRFRRGDEWLVTTVPCILLQRTTAKEQDKRLIAAVLPHNVVKKYKGVAVENHINMIIPVHAAPAISIQALNFFLNSKAANDAFRSMSGSVAISAYELESFPLPDPNQLRALELAVKHNASDEEKETICFEIYSKHK